MSRIEIPMEEYTGFQDRIKAFEATVNDLRNENTQYREKIEELEEMISDLENTSIFERIFKWKKMFNDFNKERHGDLPENTDII